MSRETKLLEPDVERKLAAAWPSEEVGELLRREGLHEAHLAAGS